MKDSTKITGAEAILLSLLKENVDTIFGCPSGAIMPIYDKIYDRHHELKHILVRHEQGAAHASGVFAAGDCITKNYRQVTTAVAEGTIAALSAAEYLWVQK